MDVVLEVFDTFLLDRVYSAVLPAASNEWRYKPATRYLRLTPGEAAFSSAWSRDNILRQAISLFLITWSVFGEPEPRIKADLPRIFGLVVYFFFSTLSFYTVFDRETVLNHPKLLKNQIRLEIAQAARAMPVMAICTVPFFLLEIRGFTKLYDSAAEAPSSWYQWAQIPLFLAFTDGCIYWIHRGLHHPLIYKALHKPHHRWLMPTPYASYAFHPLDGFAQSLPYHVFPFLFPLQKLAYIALFALVNIWTIIIHDGEFASHGPVVNGAAHHTVHHLYFNYNYGQYTTLWDRLGGSYRTPDEALLRSESKAGGKDETRTKKEL